MSSVGTETKMNEIFRPLAHIEHTQHVNFARPCDGPHLHDGCPQLQVSLVHLRTLPDIDLEIVSDQSKQCGGE